MGEGETPQQPPPPQQSKTVQVCAIIFMALGIGGYQAVAPSLFPTPPGGGFNMQRMVWAAIVGAIAGALGVAVGKAIDSMRK